MNFLNHEWLGFAATPEDAVRIIKDTGIFYLSISIAYLFSYFYMAWHSSSTKKMKGVHYFSISMWAFNGIWLILQPHFFSFFFNFLVTLLALVVLYQLYFTSILTAQVPLAFSKVNTEDKKVMYAKTLIKKMDYTLSDVFGVTLINEQILWMLILYRAAIAFRASFGL